MAYSDVYKKYQNNFAVARARQEAKLDAFVEYLGKLSEEELMDFGILDIEEFRLRNLVPALYKENPSKAEVDEQFDAAEKRLAEYNAKVQELNKVGEEMLTEFESLMSAQ